MTEIAEGKAKGACSKCGNKDRNIGYCARCYGGSNAHSQEKLHVTCKCCHYTELVDVLDKKDDR